MDIISSSQHALEWPTFLKQYSKFCYSEPAKQRALELAIPEAQSHSELLLDLTEEAIIFVADRNFSEIESMPNLEQSFERLAKAACLSGTEILAFANLIQISKLIFDYLNQAKFEDFKWKYQLQELQIFPEIAKTIYYVINDQGEVKDSASDRLRHLRKEEKRLHQEAATTINKILKKAVHDGVAQDEYFDMRDGRYVIPVKNESQSQLEGIVYEKSSSRATVFMEPSSMRNTNDRIRQIQIDIEEEIYRILLELTQKIYPHAASLWRNYELILDFDLGVAKAKIANNFKDYKCSAKPKFENQFHLEDLYHPLLRFVIPNTEIVTNNFSLAQQKKVLLISGPNTGGKTVILKAIGLCSIMSKCGFYLPCADNCSIPYFKTSLAHIGDDQSIEQSLSSFSSSIFILKQILEQADENCLVLIDEILNSTDPQEASALSEATLEHLANLGTNAIVTTHLNELKKIADNNNAFLNASMEFNLEDLSPTFKLRIGIPGRSRAIETATRLGLDNSIIIHAQKVLGSDHNKIDSLLANIETKEAELEQVKSKLSAKLLRAEQEIQKASLEKEKFRSDRKSLRESSRLELEKLQRTAMNQLDEVISEYKKKLANLPNIHKEAKDVRRKIIEVKRAFQPAELREEEKTEETKYELQLNCRVKISNLNMEGILLSDPKSQKKDAKIQVGNMQLKAKWKNLVALESKATTKNNQQKTYSTQHTAYVDMEYCAPELNLLGLRVDEAISQLENYLDTAFRSDRPSVRIIHGFGSGILRKAVRDFLKNCDYKLSFRAGKQEEGSDGCTVVEFNN